MKSNTITIKHAVIISRRREIVWDYTQDFNNRSIWDSSIVEATVLQDAPHRIVKLKAKGNTSMTFHYKLDDRPHKTSLVAQEVNSPIIQSAGGSWTYDKIGSGTIWKQTNSIVFKSHMLFPLVKPFIKWYLQKQTEKSMDRVRRALENS